MSLREEMWRYEQITGESAEHVPIIKLGAFLDGYDMGIKALKQQPAEDCISRTELLARIDAERKHLLDIKMYGAEHIVVHHARRIIEDMPSVTPSYNSVKTELEPCEDCVSRKFVEIVISYPQFCVYEEYKGKPYFSIKYTENGQEFIGFGTYKLEVLSEYLRNYFMTPQIEPCEDCVSREAVLEFIADDNISLGQVVKNIHALPPVTPKTEWIPCSERLPEVNGRYVVTRGLNACGALWNRIYIINYSDLMGLKSERIWWDGNFGKSDFKRIDDVIAWMPLPQSYKAESEEE